MALCSVPDANGVLQLTALDPVSCPGPVLLSASDYSNWQASLISLGWDSALFEKTVAAGLAMFAVGLGVGLLISVVR